MRTGAEPPASDLSRLGKGLGIRQMCVSGSADCAQDRFTFDL